ncbi:MAG: hypothetical protein JWN70_1126 [Planctomycetaceae bacterium]|nr:hypothetical protein [Planctomycetaceae bacterium]
MSTTLLPIEPGPQVAHPWPVLLIMQPICWLCTLMGIVSLLFPLFAVAALTYFFRSRSPLVGLIFLLTSPVAVPALLGTCDYFRGTARLQYRGLPGTTFHNLDPQLRCGRASSGCIVGGNEWVTHLPYNGTVRTLMACLGPMPGTYLGPYPTQEDSEQALVNATAVPVHDLLNDRVNLGSVVVQFDTGVGEELWNRINRYSMLAANKQRIKASLWRDECVVLFVPSSIEDEERDGAIVLLSRAVGRPFAYYPVGNYSHHFPPVTWNRMGR